MTPDAALTNILSGVSAIGSIERVPLGEALGRIASEDITSSVRLPAFDNSAMDGFCVHADDLGGALPFRLRLQAELRAGERPDTTLRPGHAIRIMTGAMVPDGAAAVVLDEGAEVADGAVTIHRTVTAGKNIRRTGEDVQLGTTIVPAGSLLTARHLALLAVAGVGRVVVRRAPRVGVMSTGNELLEPGNEAGNGRIVEINRFFLLSMLRLTGAVVTDLGIVPDDLDSLAGAFANNRGLDLIVTSGGVAGSDADLVTAAVSAAGGNTSVCALALRPGKPIAFGSLGACRTLHLPGNPMAALVTGFLFMLPLVRMQAGLDPHNRPAIAKTAGEFHHVPRKTEFVPVRIVGPDADGIPLVEMLGKGGSARLLPLVMADGLAELPASRGSLDTGEFVPFYSFRQMGLA
ncbi:molybdopterin molybdenumtransferase MoeA [Pseudaminobacter arsenicus]|uniref:Molybdopterin molybdenumtransferase n=1 Tax=Borborobacter arsenicus TaxID=1851146 RepID=A0A432VA45_9HYPH|nr:gephyrin-like molybdotransferase Glp [Pseudaminobacter arsenicus]RUM99058.1 molybdopterin molybdenumtransferase MoeA [Pseudaminobacter arsenicus]